MPYSEFSLRKVKQDFGLTIVEQQAWLPQHLATDPSPYLIETLERNLPLAIALATEKARSELLICPILVEVREQLSRQVSLFSGVDFTVDPAVGLNGICDFLMARSLEQLLVESPVIVVVEAKKEDINSGLGQCIAEMVAAQKFNLQNDQLDLSVYGVVTTGTLWRFLKIEKQTIFIDLMDYSIPPVNRVLGILVTLAQGNLAVL